MVGLLRTLLSIGTGFVMSLLVSCADLGNGSEITNGVVRLQGITVENGKPCSGVLVTAFETNFIPLWAYNAPPVRAISDSAGNFSIPLFNAATYNILISDTVTSRGAFRKNVFVDTASSVLGGIELDSLGAIYGNIYGDTTKIHTYNVFVAGSPFFAKVTGNSNFTIPDLPAENYDLSVTVFKSDAFMIVVTPVKSPVNSYTSNGSPVIIGSKKISVFAGATAKVDSLKVSF
jgi:hypothetical protein